MSSKTLEGKAKDWPFSLLSRSIMIPSRVSHTVVNSLMMDVGLHNLKCQRSAFLNLELWRLLRMDKVSKVLEVAHDLMEASLKRSSLQGQDRRK